MTDAEVELVDAVHTNDYNVQFLISSQTRSDRTSPSGLKYAYCT